MTALAAAECARPLGNIAAAIVIVALIAAYCYLTTR